VKHWSKRIAVALAFSGAVPLAGCVGGTTYGTGVGQEEQTFRDLYTMFKLQKERKNIDYATRPDLIVPQNKQVLPEPLSAAETANNDPNWPESPEQRIARVRAQAGETDPRNGEYSLQDRLRKKEGIAVETYEPKGKFVPGKTDRDGNPLLAGGQSEARKQVLAARASADYSRGPSRKYLTEPPVEYRVPAETAPAGQEAFTEEELKAREEEEKRLKKEKFKAATSKN
jgi:hypothetical protein